MKKLQNFINIRNATTSFEGHGFSHTALEIKGHNFFVEHQIDLKFSENNDILLKYYMTIPCFSDDEQTVRNNVYFFETLFKKVVFFGLLQVPMMTLPRQPVFWVSLVTFLSFSLQQFKISGSSSTPTFQYHG